MFIKSSKIYCTISFTSADNNALINYLNKIKLILLYNKNYKYTLVSKPQKVKRFFILRSPHVYKKSIETFEEKIYRINFKLTILDLKNYKLKKVVFNNAKIDRSVFFDDKIYNNSKKNIQNIWDKIHQVMDVLKIHMNIMELRMHCVEGIVLKLNVSMLFK